MNGPNLPNKPQEGNNISKNILVWLFIIFSVFTAMFYIFGENESVERVSYNRYLEFLSKSQIESATIQPTQGDMYEFIGTLKEPVTIERYDRQVKVEKFSTQIGVLDSDTEKLWERSGLEWKYKESDSMFWGTVLQMLPLVILFILLIFIFKRMQGGGGGGGQKGIFSFGKARIKLMNEGQPKITFSDVAGADEAKYELQEIIEFLKEPTKFKKLGGKIPRGVLLLGPPGTGKTLMARAVAGEAGVPFFSMSGADFVEMFVGVGASRVRDLFEQAKKNSPCIVFIDEIDAVGRQRGAGLGGGHDEREQTLNQLLVEMDGFEQNSGVIIIAATNRPDVLDPALLRPGRFDRQVVVDKPDVRGREGIFKVHTKKIPLGDDVSLEILAKGTPGLSGADIANIVNEAALLAARRNSEKVIMYDFENAKDKILMGVERKSMVLSDKEKEITAYHEMGHALVSVLLESLDPVHKVTIIPRGRALGVTSYLPSEEYHSKSKKYLETMLAMMMGGRAAEKIIFGIRSTGASSDIERASNIARKMVCEWGMSDSVGPINFATENDDVFLGKEIGHNRSFSEKTALAIDDEVKRILMDANQRAENVLTENLELLHLTSKVLIERETIDSVELASLLKGEELPPISEAKIEALKQMGKENGIKDSPILSEKDENKNTNTNLAK